MKKNYTKPEVEIVVLKVDEQIMDQVLDPSWSIEEDEDLV